MKLIFAVDVVRHGERAQIHYIPQISADIQEGGMGQLTMSGREGTIGLARLLGNIMS